MCIMVFGLLIVNTCGFYRYMDWKLDSMVDKVDEDEAWYNNDLLRIIYMFFL